MSWLLQNKVMFLSRQSLHKNFSDEHTIYELEDITESTITRRKKLMSRLWQKKEILLSWNIAREKNLLMSRVFQKVEILLSQQWLKINFSDELAIQKPTNITESAITGGKNWWVDYYRNTKKNTESTVCRQAFFVTNQLFQKKEALQSRPFLDKNI